jgi:hypothetical protein
VIASERHAGLLILHVDVAVRWWLPHLPQARESQEFLYERLSTGTVRLITYEAIELRVLEAIAEDLGANLDAFLAQSVVQDVQGLFGELQQRGILQLVSPREGLPAAMLAAGLYRIPLHDALLTILAEAREAPLLVADRERRSALMRLERDRPGFRVAWLPDELGGAAFINGRANAAGALFAARSPASP